MDVMSDQFRLITLSSNKFDGALMQPAAKVRLNAGNWEMRAYTPLSFDAMMDRVQILAYLHGDGPGSTWARSTAPGDSTHIMGLQESLKLTTLFARPGVPHGSAEARTAILLSRDHCHPMLIAIG